MSGSAIREESASPILDSSTSQDQKTQNFEIVLAKLGGSRQTYPRRPLSGGSRRQRMARKRPHRSKGSRTVGISNGSASSGLPALVRGLLLHAERLSVGIQDHYPPSACVKISKRDLAIIPSAAATRRTLARALIGGCVPLRLATFALPKESHSPNQSHRPITRKPTFLESVCARSALASTAFVRRWRCHYFRKSTDLALLQLQRPREALLHLARAHKDCLRCNKALGAN